MKLKKRHRLRRKEAGVLAERLSSNFGCEVFSDTDNVDGGTAPDCEVVMVKGEVLAFIKDGVTALTVRGLIKYGPTKAFVEVDMGAIPYVMNGADIMAPGVVAADDEIKPDDVVWIRDEKNKRPLAVGLALMTGPKMVSSKKGKAVRTLHYYGDGLWNIVP